MIIAIPVSKIIKRISWMRYPFLIYMGAFFLSLAAYTEDKLKIMPYLFVYAVSAFACIFIFSLIFDSVLLNYMYKHTKEN